ncbi:MAG: hypothetical protein O2780_03850 [Proteobacteria bacterium]|nr:hypothetical protein [Pseudomonadota bacterium]
MDIKGTQSSRQHQGPGLQINPKEHGIKDRQSPGLNQYVTATLLADRGAEVLKIEEPVEGDGWVLALICLVAVEPAPGHTIAEGNARYQREIELAPFDCVEIKYQLSPTSGLVYEWNSTGEMVSDIHADPGADPKGYAESMLALRASRNAGTCVAPLAGTHGWFFENRKATTVSVNSVTAGFAEKTAGFRDGYPAPVPFQTPDRRYDP